MERIKNTEIAAVTPTRGSDRLKFVEWQKYRVGQLGYGAHYVVDYTPINTRQDIYNRIAVGVHKAIADGFKYVSIIEDDDYYPLDYLDNVKKLLEIAPVVGSDITTYYHIFNKGYIVMKHPGRSSLFTTSFHVDQFKTFPINPMGYFDIALWKRVTNFNLSTEELALGIKHGIGMCGGNGHTMRFPNKDLDGNFINSWLDAEALHFFNNIKH
jgi:hypothetical protein